MAFSVTSLFKISPLYSLPRYTDARSICASLTVFSKRSDKIQNRIPAKPRAPYNLFIKEQFPLMKDDESNTFAKKIQMISQKWSSLSIYERAKYQKLSDAENEAYKTSITSFMKKLTEEERSFLESLQDTDPRVSKLFSALKKVRKEESSSLGKPKKPLSAFFLFVQSTPNPKKLNRKELIVKCSENWKAMDEKEKQKYKDLAVKSLSEFSDRVAKWENRMLTEGRQDLVRKRTSDKGTRSKTVK